MEGPRGPTSKRWGKSGWIWCTDKRLRRWHLREVNASTLASGQKDDQTVASQALRPRILIYCSDMSKLSKICSKSSPSHGKALESTWKLGGGAKSRFVRLAHVWFYPNVEITLSSFFHVDGGENGGEKTHSRRAISLSIDSATPQKHHLEEVSGLPVGVSQAQRIFSKLCLELNWDSVRHLGTLAPVSPSASSPFPGSMSPKLIFSVGMYGGSLL
ncbi:hypothetical protein B0H16DRAFT_254510 [Mycena metata]|uniref:Uncharacterized protein n=1 Tax=Mycena metata TaxID=1033252 RepID=A0AAD7JPT3_9AGAR|nr:hypothetical protein B0H16DRAFT_254510 [Mycena metata]